MPDAGTNSPKPLPIGIYEELVTRGLRRSLSLLDPERVELGQLEPAEADDPIARYIGRLVAQVLRATAGATDQERLNEQLRRGNLVIQHLAALAPELFNQEELIEEMRQLLSVKPEAVGVGPPRDLPRPEVPLSKSALLVNARDQPRIGSEVNRELASTDEVDLICAFVKWTGLRIVERSLSELISRGGRIRVLTTAYMGATDRRAVDALAALGADVKVSYDVRTTRLHAKAWLFRRRSGADTAYVGSSNLSKSALVDGLEWNVRLSSMEQPHVIEAFKAAFDDYWEDAGFEMYDPGRDRDRLDLTLAAERGERGSYEESLSLHLTPYPYQAEVLEQLEAERVLHGRWRNLVVMATGTGKTVVSALDYERLRRAGQVSSLLFVAHREELLRQSRSTFRAALRDGSFGETFVGGEVPSDWHHVFASVQSLSRTDRLEALSADSFDMIVVDEFHHAEAETYSRLLDYFNPRVLLGLTATPERTDGQDVTHWFGGRIAVELRLWEALERGLLAPFQYFGIHDDVDISHVPWRRGSGYELAELSKVYTGHDARARMAGQALQDKVRDLGSIRALGFCVTIDHAEFMAKRFNEFGISSTAISARSPREARLDALRQLRDREINVLFAVDLFNEGIDLPEIDTVLFLRPTESATVFLQQLGRGLRLAEDKDCLTVLDFVGNQNARFRFDLRYRALTGVSRRELARQVEAGFPYLPAGCHIDLDREVSRLVLRNVSRALSVPWRDLVGELVQLGDVDLKTFLSELSLEPEDVYRTQRGGWSALRRAANLPTSTPGPNDEVLARAIGRTLHLDDVHRLALYRDWLRGAAPPRVPSAGRRLREIAMFHFLLWGRARPIEEAELGLADLWREPARRAELAEVLDLLAARLEHVTAAIDEPEVPLRLHAHYTAREVLAAFGDYRIQSFYGQGVRWVESAHADLLFVDLRKTEKHYSPTTMYRDRALTPTLFQWESQSTTSEGSPTGQRYIHHRERRSSVHLFVRETKTADGGLGAPAFLYAGQCSYVQHTGDRPMRISWRLQESLPAEFFSVAKVISG